MRMAIALLALMTALVSVGCGGDDNDTYVDPETGVEIEMQDDGAAGIDDSGDPNDSSD